GHPNAELAARAALAANDQGKFWPYVDQLIRNPGALDEDSLLRYASVVGLSPVLFRAALGSAPLRARVARETAEGQAAGASSSPTFFINGTLLAGAQPIDKFKAIIDRELAASGGLGAPGASMQ